MSATPDNDSERDATLAAIYRAAGQDMPPPALDSAILAAARREVGARPRPAGHTFARTLRAPLSLAAVVVLSVSLIMLMREEAPELVAPPRADTPVAASVPEPTGRMAGGTTVTVDQGFARDEPKSKSLGLKPPQSLSSSGLGMRQPELVVQSPQAKNDSAPDRAAGNGAATALLEKRRAASADAQRENYPPPPASPRADATGPAPALESVVSAAPPIADAGQVATGGSENKVVKPLSVSPAAPGASQLRSAPAARATGKLELPADLSPEKWLEYIEELRKRGRLDEAKSSLAEFRKRYPDYRLPDRLRDWALP